MSLPLDGLNVLLTRAAHQVEAPAAKLRELGANVIHIPVIEISPPESWQTFDECASRMAEYDWVIFVSANAVDAFFGRLKVLGKEKLQLPQFATIGPKTTEVLQNHGHKPVYQAQEFVAESFVRQFPANKGERVLWPKANIGRMLIAEELVKQGVTIDAVHVYRTTLPRHAEDLGNELKLLLLENGIDVITFASSQTVKNFRLLLDMVALPTSSLQNIKILAIGPETARTATEVLGKCDLQASEYTVDGMIEALLSLNS